MKLYKMHLWFQKYFHLLKLNRLDPTFCSLESQIMKLERIFVANSTQMCWISPMKTTRLNLNLSTQGWNLNQVLQIIFTQVRPFQMCKFQTPTIRLCTAPSSDCFKRLKEILCRASVLQCPRVCSSYFDKSEYWSFLLTLKNMVK